MGPGSDLENWQFLTLPGLEHKSSAVYTVPSRYASYTTMVLWVLRKAYNMLVGNPEDKILRGTPGRSRENNRWIWRRSFKVQQSIRWIQWWVFVDVVWKFVFHESKCIGWPGERSSDSERLCSMESVMGFHRHKYTKMFQNILCIPNHNEIYFRFEKDWDFIR
jgi:hypothetical protein